MNNISDWKASVKAYNVCFFHSLDHSLREIYNQYGNYKYLCRILRYRHDNLEYVTPEKNYTARNDMGSCLSNKKSVWSFDV